MTTVTLSGPIPSGFSSTLAERAVQETFVRARKSAKGSVAIRFVSEAEIAKLNAAYRGKRKPTDVLSFSVDTTLPKTPRGEEKEYGDIVIAAAYARREAKRRGIRLPEELTRLVVHGTLHLLGYDHATEKDEVRMFGLQEEIIERIDP